MNNRHPWQLKKIIWHIFVVNRLNWQCCLAGSSKTAPRFLIFSIAMGADYSFELISIETYMPQFNRHNTLILGSAKYVGMHFCTSTQGTHL